MIEYREYAGGDELDIMKAMIDGELSEPYTIYTYRYFIRYFPELTFAVIFHLSPTLYLFLNIISYVRLMMARR